MQSSTNVSQCVECLHFSFGAKAFHKKWANTAMQQFHHFKAIVGVGHCCCFPFIVTLYQFLVYFYLVGIFFLSIARSFVRSRSHLSMHAVPLFVAIAWFATISCTYSTACHRNCKFTFAKKDICNAFPSISYLLIVFHICRRCSLLFFSSPFALYHRDDGWHSVKSKVFTMKQSTFIYLFIFVRLHRQSAEQMNCLPFPTKMRIANVCMPCNVSTSTYHM